MANSPLLLNHVYLLTWNSLHALGVQQWFWGSAGHTLGRGNSLISKWMTNTSSASASSISLKSCVLQLLCLRSLSSPWEAHISSRVTLFLRCVMHVPEISVESYEDQLEERSHRSRFCPWLHRLCNHRSRERVWQLPETQLDGREKQILSPPPPSLPSPGASIISFRKLHPNSDIHLYA